jgi:hypothetical protein
MDGGLNDQSAKGVVHCAEFSFPLSANINHASGYPVAWRPMKWSPFRDVRVVMKWIGACHPA